MYKAREFTVKVESSEYDADWALTDSHVYEALTNALGFSDTVWVKSVTRVVPPGKVFSGKIPAIKELRAVLQISLLEAKDMVDAATALGRFRTHGGISITYDAGTTHYTITDNR